MVVVSMSQEKGLKAEIPEPAPKSSVPPPERTIVIQMELALGEQPPTLRINEEGVGWTDLEPRLREIFTPGLEKVAFVKADKQIDFEPVAQVIDLAHAAGVDHVGLLLLEPKQEAGIH